MQVPAHFRRAVNVLQYLIDRALSKTANAIALQPDEDVDVVIESEATIKYWQQAFDYSRLLREAFALYDQALKRDIKDSGLGATEYWKQRQASREHNMDRYKVCYLPIALSCLC